MTSAAIIFGTLGLAIGSTPPIGSTPEGEPPALGSLAERTDPEATARVVERLDAQRRAHPEDLRWVEALLRARKFWADGTPDEARSIAIHRRNVEDGLAALSDRMHRRLESFDDLADAAPRITDPLVGVAYWTTLSFGRTIPGRPILARPGAARDFRRVLERLVEVDRGYFHGGPLRALAMYDVSAPALMGGDRERAIRHALDAMRLAPGFAPNRVVLAQVALSQDLHDRRVVGLLEGALEPSAGIPPDAEPEHHRAQERAGAILEELR